MISLPEWFHVEHRTTPDLECFERAKPLLQSSHWDGCAANILTMFPDIDSFMDLGCGGGMLPTAVKKQIKGNSIGYDVLEEAVIWGQQNNQLVSFGVSWDLPTNDKFYLCYSSHVLEHLPIDYLIKTLHELDRVVSNYICMVIPFVDSVGNQFVDSSQDGNKWRSCGHFIHQPKAWWEKALLGVLVGWEFFIPKEILAPWETVDQAHNFFLKRR